MSDAYPPFPSHESPNEFYNQLYNLLDRKFTFLTFPHLFVVSLHIRVVV